MVYSMMDEILHAQSLLYDGDVEGADRIYQGICEDIPRLYMTGSMRRELEGLQASLNEARNKVAPQV